MGIGLVSWIVVGGRPCITRQVRSARESKRTNELRFTALRTTLRVLLTAWGQ
jgi:hypothetical protein